MRCKTKIHMSIYISIYIYIYTHIHRINNDYAECGAMVLHRRNGANACARTRVSSFKMHNKK